MRFQLDSGSRTPIYEQLIRQVREAAARGDLEAEERLPSVRELARELVVNPNTILRAFGELEREGLLVSRRGLGYFVASPRRDLTKAARRRRLLESLDAWLTEAVHLGFSAEETLEMVGRRVGGFQWNGAKRECG
jgi:GntR family transcriptional regulator